MSVYRTPAAVDWIPLPPLPLRPHIEVIGGGCPACGVARAHIKAARDSNIKERFCVGGRSGFMWRRRCRETRAHMHQTCITCGAFWITAPRTDASYG